MTTEEQDIPHEWNPNDVILDLYEVRQVIEGFGDQAKIKDYHEGGFGRVYKVWHKTWQREMAVKCPRAHLFKSDSQKVAYSRECELWINLGLHPNVASCHYVRNLGGVPRIFSEYAEAGTLEDWIRSRRLYEGGEQESLKRILDVAIQFAWGLHFAHEHNIVHQDVKPLNALMWNDGTLKVSDFGLAAAEERVGLTRTPKVNEANLHSILVSSGGMTPAYCSPEQYARKQIDRRSDIWSWAVSVFEMFAGEILWRSGTVAGAAFKAFLNNNEQISGIPNVPNEIASILSVCFNAEPSMRPKTLYECAESLRQYQSVFQTVGRSEPEILGDQTETLNNRALSLLDLGHRKAAEDIFDQIHNIQKLHVATEVNRGLLRWRSGKCLDSDILHELEELQRSKPHDIALAVATGYIQLECNRYSDARASFLRALDLGAKEEVAALHKYASKRLAEQSGAEIQIKISSTSEGFNKGGQFMPASQRLISYGSEGIACWSVETGACHWKVVEMYCHSLSVSKDEAIVAVGTIKGLVLLLDGNSGQVLNRLEGHLACINSIAFSPTQQIVATASGNQEVEYAGNWIDDTVDEGLTKNLPKDSTIRLWNHETGVCTHILEGNTDSINQICYNGDGQILVSSGENGYKDNDIRFYDTKTGTCLEIFKTSGSVISLFMLANGSTLAFGLSDYCFAYWDIINRKQLLIIKHGVTNIIDAGFASQQYALSLSNENFRYRLDFKTIRLWDLKTQQCIFSRETDGWFLALSANHKYAALGLREGIILQELASILTEPVRCPWQYSMPRDLNAALEDKRRHLLLLNEAKLAFECGTINHALSLVADAQKIHTFGQSEESLLLKAQIGTRCIKMGVNSVWIKRVLQHDSQVLTGAISSDDKWILTGGSRSRSKERLTPMDSICLWDLNSGNLIASFKKYTGERIHHAIFSPNSEFVCIHAVACSPRDAKLFTLEVWDVQTQTLVHNFGDSRKLCHDITYSSDGKYIISSNGGCLEVADATNGALIRVLKPPGKLAELSIYAEPVKCSPDGTLVASVFGQNTICIWDLNTFELNMMLQPQQDSHKWITTCIAFSPDWAWFVTGGEDCCLRVWETASGQLRQVLTGHNSVVGSVCISPDGMFILSGCVREAFGGWNTNRIPDDKLLNVWDTRTGKCVRKIDRAIYQSGTARLAFSKNQRYALAVSGMIALLEFDWNYTTDE